MLKLAAIPKSPAKFSVINRLRLWFFLTGLGLSGQAQTVTYVVDQFNPAGTGGYSYTGGQINNIWTNWFGTAFLASTWDSANDANNNASSGSLKITANFSASLNQYEVFNGYGGINPPLSGQQYTNFQCDVRFAAGSATTTNNGTASFGHLQFGVRTASFGQDYFGSADVAATNTGWVHISLPLNAATDTNLIQLNDVLIHIYGPTYSSGLTGTSTLWVDNIQFLGAAPVTSGSCTVDGGDVHQRIDGFGASSAWQSSWSTALADMFYSANNGTGVSRNGTNFSFTGIGLSLLRTRVAPGATTVEQSIMTYAQARGAKVWSTPWSPAANFKSNGNVNGGGFLGNPANYQAYASQLAGYVSAMKNSYGIKLYALSVQNEPDANVTSYESCNWSAQQFHDFIPYLYNAFAASNVAATKIILPESQNWADYSNLVTMTMSDATSNQVAIIADHNYDGANGPGSLVKNSYGKALWETEVSLLSGSDSSISNGVYYAGRIHSFLTGAQANAWHYWWLVPGNSTGNQGLTDTNGVPAKRMYALGQFSRFVRPGYYRLGTANITAAQISAYAYPGSGNIAIIAINNTTSVLSQTFVLTNFSAPAVVTPWITTSNLSLAPQSTVPVASSAFSYQLPAMSVVTFVAQTNLAPTDVSLLNLSVAENLASNTVVGSLVTEDPDIANTFSYALVSGTGSVDNNSFAISNNVLRTASVFDYETKNTYEIRIRSTDQGGLYFEKTFAISVTGVNEAPLLSPVMDQTINAGMTLVITNSATDVDQPAQSLTFNLLNAPTNATLNPSNGFFQWRPLLSQANSTNVVTTRVVDNGTPALSATNSFKVTVSPLTRPVLDFIGVSSGQLTLVMNGQYGPDYALLTSTDLVNWRILFTTNSPMLPLTLTSTNVTTNARGFYRIQVSP